MENSQKLHVYITGFGKFANVLTNPTSELVNNLITLHSEGKLNVEGLDI